VVSAVDAVGRVGAGVALWATAPLLISIPTQFPIWVRGFGIVASALFMITAARIFWGEQVLPTASPLPFFAYPFLVITFIGWIWTNRLDFWRTGSIAAARNGRTGFGFDE
jgi:hypothetical protein